MPNQQPLGLRQVTFLPGVSDFLPLDLLQDNESARLQNAEVHKTGALRRRSGLTTGAMSLAITGEGRPWLLRGFSAPGHTALCAVVNTGTLTASFLVDDGQGGLLNYPSARPLGPDVELVQILDRLYVLEAGMPPLYWKWGNVQLEQEGGGVTGMPYAGTAAYFRGRAWAGLNDLVYFSRYYGAQDYESHLKDAETALNAVVNNSMLQGDRRGTARTAIRDIVVQTTRAARAGKQESIVISQIADQPTYSDFTAALTSLGASLGLSLAAPMPALQTESKPLSHQFLWDTEFQAFRMVTGEIVKILPYRDNALIVFTRRGIELIEPDPANILESTRNTFALDIGCAAKQTVQLAGEDVYFMDQEGNIRSLAQTELEVNKGVLNAPVSLKIQRVMDRQSKQFLRNSRSVVFDGIYWVFMPLDGAQFPTEGWGYNIRDKSWVGPLLLDQSLGGSEALQFPGAKRRCYILTGNASIARSFQLFEGTSDRGTAITMEYRSPNFTAKNPSVRKTWLSLDVEARVLAQLSLATSQLTISARGDEGAWQSVGILTLGTNASPGLISLPGTNVTYGASLSFRLVPDSRQRLKIPLTSVIPRSHGLQLAVGFAGATNEIEILQLTLWGLVDPEEYTD